MTTNPVNNSSNSGSGSSSTTSSTAAAAQLNLTPTDFLNMMITQLQNQDPLNPTDSSQILSQMSEIGQLQSSNSLQTTLQNFGLQTSLGSASALMGKSVQGIDSNNKTQSGTVTSIQVVSGNVTLNLNNGATLPLNSVSSIAPGSSTTSTTSTTATN